MQILNRITVSLENTEAGLHGIHMPMECQWNEKRKNKCQLNEQELKIELLLEHSA